MKFKIKAGKHYSRNFLGMRLLFGKGINFSFRISRSAMYDPAAVVNGWSKVFGIAEPLGHTNSCRLVYGCFTKDVLTVGMYCYVRGKSPQENTALKQTLGDIQPDIWYNCQIAHFTRNKDHFYYVAIWGNGIMRSFDMPCKPYRLGLRFLLHPYIGGRYTLEQDALIEIDKLK